MTRFFLFFILITLSTISKADVVYGIYQSPSGVVAILPDGTAYRSCHSCLYMDTTYTKWEKYGLSSIKMEDNNSVWLTADDKIKKARGIKESYELKTAFYKNGNVKKRASWARVDGYRYVRSGVWLNYYENGMVKAITHYEDDQKNGEHLAFDSLGVMILREHYLDNQLHGLRINYFHSGIIKSTVNYENNLPTGKADYYYETGFLALTGNWKKGQRHGTWLAIAPNKINRVELVYKNGELLNEKDASLKVVWVEFKEGEDILEKIQEKID